MYILNRYLLKNAMEKSGIKSRLGQFDITEEAKKHMIKYYARESGVRSLEKFITRITEKLAYKIVEDESKQEETVTNPESNENENENEKTDERSSNERTKIEKVKPYFEVTPANIKE